MRVLLSWLVLVLLAWGALSFGAVYPWAYWPLCGGAAVAGAMGAWIGGWTHAPGRCLIGTLAAILIAIAVQMIPLSERVLGRISPNTVAALNQLDPAFAVRVKTTHALSINPKQTRTSVVLFASFALLAIGLAASFTATGAERTIGLLIALGVILALIGIIQKPLYSGSIYGFWALPGDRNPFGPFVNRNHFAGWMLMAVPLTLGYFCMSVTRAMRGVKASARDRALWLSSPDGSKLLLVGMAAIVMVLALAMTRSRSGIGSMALAVLLTGWLFLRGATSTQGKAVVVTYLLALVVLVFVWTGAETITGRFANADWTQVGARRGAWLDALQVSSLFPLAGTGVNTYGDAMLLYQTYIRDTVHFGAAHNDYLQLLAEGGLLVTIPAAVALAGLVIRTRRGLREDRGSSYYWLRAGAATALVAIGVQEIVEFSLQMPGNAALFAIVCAVAIHKRPLKQASGESPDSRAVAIPA